MSERPIDKEEEKVLLSILFLLVEKLGGRVELSAHEIDSIAHADRRIDQITVYHPPERFGTVVICSVRGKTTYDESLNIVRDLSGMPWKDAEKP
jgi:hypothetical protein